LRIAREFDPDKIAPVALDGATVRQYLTNMRTSLSSKGQIVLPAGLRERDGLQPGQQFDIRRVKAGEYRLKALPLSAKPGLVLWLKACPEKDWFQRIPSESTSDI
jgi:AbrB family looped-hinge helix DNA binding protein